MYVQGNPYVCVFRIIHCMCVRIMHGNVCERQVTLFFLPFGSSSISQSSDRRNKEYKGQPTSPYIKLSLLVEGFDATSVPQPPTFFTLSGFYSQSISSCLLILLSAYVFHSCFLSRGPLLSFFFPFAIFCQEDKNNTEQYTTDTMRSCVYVKGGTTRGSQPAASLCARVGGV